MSGSSSLFSLLIFFNFANSCLSLFLSIQSSTLRSSFLLGLPLPTLLSFFSSSHPLFSSSVLSFSSFLPQEIRQASLLPRECCRRRWRLARRGRQIQACASRLRHALWMEGGATTTVVWGRTSRATLRLSHSYSLSARSFHLAFCAVKRTNR